MRLPRWLRRKRPTRDPYEDVRARLNTLPPSLTEERVREILREEMARSARRVGRTPGLAGSMKK